ncbi:hypothetical protein FKM82_023153 [Ascaphus truei]
MSEQDTLNQETLEEPGREQEPETSPTTPEKSIINQTESLESDKKKDEKLCDANTEIQKRSLNQNQQKKRSKSAKGKLMRSLAVCEEPTPRAFGKDYQENQ